MLREWGSSLAASEYFSYIIEIIQKNEEFVRNNAKKTYEEVVELINDAIDELMVTLKDTERERNYFKYSIIFFIHHVLIPFSYAIYLDLLAGNVPACFIELRLMLESLAKCYLSDSRYPEKPSFWEKFELLEQETVQRNLSISKLLRELDNELIGKDSFVALWGKLSQDWVHAKGFIDRLVAYLIDKFDIPAWALVIPMNYTNKDLDILEELRNRISQFRRILKTTIKKWKTEIYS